MYGKIAQNVARYFTRKQIIDDANAEIYEYGFEILLSTIVYLTVFVVLSLMTDSMVYSLLFFLSFLIVRKTAGGYHASTYLRCHLLFFINHLLFIIGVNLYPLRYTPMTSIIVILTSAILILIFAPVAHPNRPFIKTERMRFRKLSIGYAILLIFLAFPLSYFSMNIKSTNEYIFAFSFGLMSASISLLIEKIKQQRKDLQQ